MQDTKNRQKFAIWAPSHKFVGLATKARIVFYLFLLIFI